MAYSKIWRVLILVSLMVVLSTTFVSAATFILLQTGAGTVNGNPSEWGALNTSNPYYITDLCVNGDCVNQPQVGRLFAHYTCDNQMIYFAVAANTGLTNTVSATENLLAQNTPANILMVGGAPYTTNTDQNQPIWRYFTTGGSGFEAGYPFSVGTVITLYVQAYINATPGGAPQVASTGVHNYIVPGCGTTAVTLSSFNAQGLPDASNLMLGLVGVIGMVALTSAGVVLWHKMS